MKIVFINFYSGVINRGGETYVHEVAQRLVKKHQVFVIQSGGNKKDNLYQTVSVGIESKANYPLDWLPNTHILKRLFLTPRQISELIFTIKTIPHLIKLNPDIILPLNSGYQALLMSIYSRLFSKKLVIAGQSGIGWNDRWNLFVKPDLFIALTNKQLNWAKEATLWKKQKIIKIANGVDLNRFRTEGKRVKLNLPKPTLIITAASIASKRITQTIIASAKANVSLLVLGSGHMDKQIDNLGNKLLGKRFRHLSVDHNSIPQYYRSGSAFTLCSDNSEAFGIVYLEAMATGLPVIATNDQSRKEIVGNAGVFVNDPNDSQEYSQAIIQTIKKDWNNLPQKQAAKFSWDKIANQYLSALSKLR